MKNASTRLRVHKFWRKGKRSGRVSISNDKATFVAIEVAFLTQHYGFGIETDSEEGFTVNFMGGLAAIWLHFPFHRFKHEREWSVRFFDAAVWISCGARKHEWRSSDPWWRSSFSWHPLDTILGRRVHSVRTIVEDRDVEIPMPEATYPAQVRIEDEQWKRPRWPFARVLRRAHVDIPGGVPHVGKWGDDDGLFAMTTPLSGYGSKRHPVEDAIGAVVASVLGSRQRYSGDHRRTGRTLKAVPK